MHPGIPIALVFLGCCSNVVFLELIISEHPGAGQIITFSQFLFIALEGFISTYKFGTAERAIPFKNYLIMVLFFFIVQVVNNMVFAYDVQVTLHIIFRAGSLIASLLLGVLILKKSYPWSKYLSVIIITVGVCICTIATANYSKSHDTDAKHFNVLRWSIGVGLLVASLILTARLGIFQEQVYSKFGKHPREALFYNHALPLPGFLLVASDIYTHTLAFNQSEPVSVVGLMIPKMWLFLAANVLTQYICIRSVFILTTECSALTVTLVVTLRKFISLVLSIIYFQNPFTLFHWVGAACVFIGTFMFTEVIPIGKKAAKEKKTQ